jgi:hypothetical protein
VFRTTIPENLRGLRKIIAPSPFRRFAVSKAFVCGCAALSVSWFDLPFSGLNW